MVEQGNGNELWMNYNKQKRKLPWNEHCVEDIPREAEIQTETKEGS